VSSRIRVIEIDPGQVETEFSVVRFYGDAEKAKKVYEGVEPLTPDDIAEVVVFAAGRRENVVIADTLVFPSHQVCGTVFSSPGLVSCLFVRNDADVMQRRRRRLCIASHDPRDELWSNYWYQNGCGLTSVYRPGRAAPCIGSQQHRNYNQPSRATQLSLSHRRLIGSTYPNPIRNKDCKLHISPCTDYLVQHRCPGSSRCTRGETKMNIPGLHRMFYELQISGLESLQARKALKRLRKTERYS
jgi:hypothetical protein